jgi:hypothetical protein
MEDNKNIVEQDYSTVMVHHEVELKPFGDYQSEAKLEADFIKQLKEREKQYGYYREKLLTFE